MKPIYLTAAIYYFFFSGLDYACAAELTGKSYYGVVQNQNPNDETIVINDKTYHIDSEVVIVPKNVQPGAPKFSVKQLLDPSQPLLHKTIGFTLDDTMENPPRIKGIWLPER